MIPFDPHNYPVILAEQELEFLFYYSDAELSSLTAKTGYNMMLEYDVKDSDLTVTRTLFIQNMVDIAEDCIVIDTAQINKIYQNVAVIKNIIRSLCSLGVIHIPVLNIVIYELTILNVT